MHNNVKKYADSNDITSLRYVFYDCLDVDPSFDKYMEDYEYACKVSGFLEDHIALTPFSNNKSEWNEDYWLSLKKDLKNNFSDKRFNHMKDVARVVHADRLKRIEDERAKKNSEEEKKDHFSQKAESKPQEIDTPLQQKNVTNKSDNNKTLTSGQRPAQKIDNSAYERQREKEAQERIKKQHEIEEANRIASEERAREEKLKKVIGIVAIIVVVIVGLIILMNR